MDINSYLRKKMQERFYFLEYKNVSWYLIDEGEDYFTYLNYNGETLQFFNKQYVYSSAAFTKEEAARTIENWKFRMYKSTHLADFR